MASGRLKSGWNLLEALGGGAGFAGRATGLAGAAGGGTGAMGGDVVAATGPNVDAGVALAARSGGAVGAATLGATVAGRALTSVARSGAGVAGGLVVGTVVGLVVATVVGAAVVWPRVARTAPAPSIEIIKPTATAGMYALDFDLGSAGRAAAEGKGDEGEDRMFMVKIGVRDDGGSTTCFCNGSVGA